MFNYLRFLFAKKYPTGLIQDTRPIEERKRDYLHEEIALAAVPVYKEGTSDLVHYRDEDQKKTFSCVAHAVTLSYTKGDPRLSKMFFYRHRINYPSAGMSLQNAGDIAKNIGSCLYKTLPNVDAENTANNIAISDDAKKEAEKYKVKNYVQLKNIDIDTLTTIINQGYPVAIVIYAGIKEWSQKWPTLHEKPNFWAAPVRHCIPAVDAFKIGDKKYLKIQDSARFGGMDVRYLSEEFIKERCYGAIYFTDLTPASDVDKPDFKFSKDLEYGQNDIEIMVLQKRLMYEGTFPVTQTPTGYFGGITLKAVKEYQLKKGLPSTGFVGPLTRGKLNES
jgi:peptidoglycan hydrolase-like protein with peptidoglycan-binding domain